MRPTILTGALLAFLSATATPVLAGAALDQYDSNKDGKISRSEFEAIQRETFARFDTNSDGKVTREELESAAQRSGGDRTMKRDSNGDGALTLSEFLANAPGFDRADRNNDGVLAGQELKMLDRTLARQNG